jgi:orotate phosphoribosyltransferase
MENKIEGAVEAGQNVVVVEDLISTGGSSLNAVSALRDAGCNVKGMVAIFTYKLHIAENNFKKHKCELVALTDYHYLIQKAVESEYIQESDLNKLLKWREDPENWGK